MARLVITERPQYKTIAELAEQDPPPDWAPVFKFALPEIRQASRIAHSLGPFFPLLPEVFTAFDKCGFPPKVVIMGQDPYHSIEYGRPQACGMAFATRRGCALQPSVRNIFNELAREYPGYQIPNHGDLEEWAAQGVLLLNSCLTVMPHVAKSHMKDKESIWSGFISKVLTSITNANPSCIFLLWGRDAQSFDQAIGERTIKLFASHPSPHSAHKDTKDAPAFIGCGHFQKVNEALLLQGKDPINWQISP